MPNTTTNTTTNEARNREIARRWTEELWGQGRLATADEIIAPDYVRHDPGDPFPARGPADVKVIVTRLRAMLPDLRLEIQDVIAAGDRVVTRYVGTATDRNGYLGLLIQLGHLPRPGTPELRSLLAPAGGAR